MKIPDSTKPASTKDVTNLIERIDYSTDMSQSIDEFAGDWFGDKDSANTVLNWKTLATHNGASFDVDPDVDLTTVRNIRFVFKGSADMSNDDYKTAENALVLAPNERLRISFRGIVPNYVAKTGEENIAWNSFAYGYRYRRAQLDPMTGDEIEGGEQTITETPMVAEPAKVGVWVPKLDNTGNIKITKKFTTSGTDTETFYFTLFTKESDTLKKFSETKKLTVSANGTESIELNDISTDKILYLYETDAVGNILTKDNSPYKIILSEAAYGDENAAMPADSAGFNNESGTVIDLTGTEKSANVAVLNTITTGSIKAVKEFTSVLETTDTFYLGLFTKDESDNYVLYEKKGRKTDQVCCS